MALAELLAGIPYVVWHGVDINEDAGDCVALRMPFRNELANYVGSFHAGALYTLAETVAGVVADRTLPPGKAFVLLRDAQIRYSRRPEGAVNARAERSNEDAAAASAAFNETARADIAVSVAMTDDTGASIFDGVFNYALRPRA